MIDENTFGNKKVLFHTLGCKLNFAESSTIGQLLAERGVQPCGKDETPDICVISVDTPSQKKHSGLPVK